MMKSYTIGENEYHVPLLNVNQNVEIAKILRACGLAGGNFSLEQMLDVITEKDELQHFLATILVPVNGKFDKANLAERMRDAGELDSETMVEVIESFFASNESWIKKLEAIFLKRFPALATNNNGTLSTEPMPPETVKKNF